MFFLAYYYVIGWVVRALHHVTCYCKVNNVHWQANSRVTPKLLQSFFCALSLYNIIMADVKSGAVSAPDQSTKTDEKDPDEKTVEKVEPLSFEKLLQDMFVLQKVISYVKYMAVSLAVWLAGRFGVGFSWVILAVVVFVLRKFYRNEKKRKEETGKALAKNEENAIRARLGDLPSWVSNFDLSWKLFFPPIFYIFLILPTLSRLCNGRWFVYHNIINN